MASQPVVVELLLDGVWTAITSDVYTRENIEITHGRADESSQPAPSSCTLTLDNRTGTYNPKNATSPLFGQIGRNTPIRVKVTGTNPTRFVGEVASWTPRRAVDDGDAWTDVVANGVSRRFGQGASPLQSPLRRGIEAAPSVVAYWPCEDDDDATELASALPGHPAMQFFGDLDLSTFAGYLASQPIPTASNLQWTGAVPAHPGNTGNIQCRFLMAVPAAGEAADATVCRIVTTGGTAVRWDLVVAATNGNLKLIARDGDGAVLHDTGFVAFLTAGKLLRVSIELASNEVDHIGLTMKTLELFGPGLQFADTLSGETLGKAAAVGMNVGGVMDETALGHVSVQTTITVLNDLDEELSAFVGETAKDRMQRMFLDEGELIFFWIGGEPTAPMGPQPADTFLNIVRECAELDLGVLYDSPGDSGMEYVTRDRIYNGGDEPFETLTLDYAFGEIAPPLEPVIDDQATRNDVTTKRTSGSSARLVQETGPLSVLAPPDGVGRYAEEVTLNTAGDGFLPNQASWRLHLGTVDETRFPRVTVDLDANPALIPFTDIVRPGWRLVIQNLPDTIAHGDVSLIVQGWTETIGSHRRVITFNCTPELPYQVGVFGADARNDRYDTAGSDLLNAITTTQTTIAVRTLVEPVWTSDDTEDGFDLEVAGERMTVTDIQGSVGLNRTFTVVRSVNGVVKSHPAGTPVSLWQPAVYAL